MEIDDSLNPKILKTRYLQKEAIDLFGEEYQLHRCVEELSEFSLAIQKLTRKEIHLSAERKASLIKDVIDELADLHIVLEYPKIIFGIDSTMIEEAIIHKTKKFKNYIDTAIKSSKEIG